MTKERELLARVISAVRSTGAGAGGTGLRLGIGDDAALMVPKKHRELVLSSDFFIEGVHFVSASQRPDSIGYKSLARAVSDLAAMGAEPAFFLFNLAMPAAKTGSWFSECLRGLTRASQSFGIRLIGGDLAQSSSVSICIAVVGYNKPGRSVLRSGARSGDLIFLSGKLGAARLGLEILLNRLQSAPGARRLLQRHMYPEPRLELGAWLARNGVASAMIDISDGLSTDLGRLCEASGTGARIDAARIPVAKISHVWKKRLRLGDSAELEFALHGGDDYELLFAVRPGKIHKLRDAPGRPPFTYIGRVTRKRRVLIVGTDGQERLLRPRGWDHFAHRGRSSGM